MRLYGLYSLMFFQIVSLYAASGKVLAMQWEGYQEYQSSESVERNDSFVLDTRFEPSEYILDWADLAEDKAETVRVIALICADFRPENRKEVAIQLRPLFDKLGIKLLRNLKTTLRDDSSFACAHSYADLSRNCKTSLEHIKSLAVRFECVGLDGAVHACYHSVGSLDKVSVLYELRNWHASLALTRSKPNTMGAVDPQLASETFEGLKKHESDLHMLIFNRKPALILQGE